MNKEDILLYRQELERIDKEILQLFCARFRTVLEVAAYKRHSDAAVYVPEVQAKKLAQVPEAVAQCLFAGGSELSDGEQRLLTAQAACLQRFLMSLSCLEQLDDSEELEKIHDCLAQVETDISGRKAGSVSVNSAGTAARAADKGAADIEVSV